MVPRIVRNVVFTFVLCGAFLGACSASVTAAYPLGTEYTDDNHSPGLPPELNPDDDGDGVQDLDDSHPNDPTRGTKPRPGPTDPIADDDGDGLPNVMDPDDNNNGIPDAEEGVSAGGRPPEPAPGRVPTPDRGKSASAGRDAPLVRALPSTGTGPGERASLVPALFTVSVFLLAASQVPGRTIRP